MNILNILSKLTEFIKENQRDLFLAACMTLIGIIGYNLGRIQALQKGEIVFDTNNQIYTAKRAPEINSGSNQQAIIAPKTTLKPKDPRVVASKKAGSKLYHFTWCFGAKRIKEENKLWFENESAAQAAGYKLAGNCNH